MAWTARIRRVGAGLRSWAKAHGLKALGLAAAIAVALFLLWAGVWQLPKRQAEQTRARGRVERARLENEFRRTAVQAAGGVVVLVTLFFAWRRIRASEAAVRATEEGQITERFTRAVEHLGDERLEVRLGGIYALERIARDSSKDHWTCMEVLCAFVREQPAPEPPEEEEVGWVSTDVQAGLTVIGRRETEHERPGQRIDLQGAHMESADLSGATLDRANLPHAHLEGANLSVAHLEGADLSKAHLDGANLWDAHLEGAGLTSAHLRDAIAVGTYLMGAGLTGATLDGAVFSEARLQGTYLMGSSLVEAQLTEANLAKANLMKSDATKANFAKSNLSGAKLKKTNLAGARLDGAVGLTQAQLDSAEGDGETTLPEGLTRPAHWNRAD